MRIISGNLKGRSISFLKSSKTRPLKDSVKENVFNIINHSNLINVKLINSNVLDLYSGIGSFGIECISRGSNSVTFVENDVKALHILNQNLKKLMIQGKTTIYQNKIVSFIKNFRQVNKYEIIFLDPPFAEDFFLEDLKLIKKYELYSKNHLVVIHREKSSCVQLESHLNVLLSKEYGKSKIIFGSF